MGAFYIGLVCSSPWWDAFMFYASLLDEVGKEGLFEDILYVLTNSVPLSVWIFRE